MQIDLQAELKQTRPFRSPLEEAFVGLQRTAAVLEHALESALKPSGVTATQYNVLRILRGAGEAGLCRSEIAERMVRRVPDVTRLLDRLEDSDLIARTRGGDDRRYVTTRITTRGLVSLESLDEVVGAFLESRMGHLAPDRLRVLNETLGTLRQHATTPDGVEPSPNSGSAPGPATGPDTRYPLPATRERTDT